MTREKHIVLSVGTSPLPVYISALTMCDENTKIYLLHTELTRNKNSQRSIVDNIEKAIKNKINGIEIKQVITDKSDIKEIKNSLKEIENDIYSNSKYEEKTVIVDYTASTKIISAQMYSYFKLLEKNNTTMKFIYIDSRNKNISIEDGKSGQIQFQNLEKTAKKFNISIEDIIALHGYKIDAKEEKSKTYYENVSIVIEGKRVLIDSIYINDFHLCLSFKGVEGETVKKGKEKLRLFETKNISNKVAGGLCYFTYSTSISQLEELENDLINSNMIEIKERICIGNSEEEIKSRIINELKFNINN